MMARSVARLWVPICAIGLILVLIALDVAAQPPRMAERPAERRPSAEEKAKYDKLGPLFDEIGKEAVQLVGGKANRLFFYADMTEELVAPTLYEDEGKSVRMYLPSLKLRGLIAEAWELENKDPDKRWVALEFDIRNGKFDATTRYAEEIDRKSIAAQREWAALSRRFAGKRLLASRVLIREMPDMAVYSARNSPIVIPPP